MPENNISKIEYLVLNGGGAKGVGYPGMYQAIHDAGLFYDLRSVSGASVGSIFAAIIAVGANPEVIRSKMIEDNLADQVGQATFLGPNIIPGLTRSLKTVESNLNIQLKETALNFLMKQKNLSEESIKVFEELKIPAHDFSFNNLFILHTQYPEQFKTLTVNAMIMGQNKLTIFDHNYNKGEISIARACTASSAMPMIFAPVKINGLYFQDGGIVDPLPSDYFSSKVTEDSIEEKAKKTLLFVFSFPFFVDAVNQKPLTFLKKSILIAANTILFPLINSLFFSINLALFLIKSVVYLLFIAPYFIIRSEFDKASALFIELSEVFCSLLTLPFMFNLVRHLKINNLPKIIKK